MTIAISCPSCDRPLKVKDDLAGKRVKCPGCGEPVLVEVADEPEPEPAIQEKPRRRVVEDDEPDDRPRKKRKKKKKSNTVLWIALGGGAALLLLLLVAGVLLFLFVFNRPSDQKGTEQAKTTPKMGKKQDVPKFDPQLNDNPRPKGGIIRAMDVQEVKNNMKQIGLAYHNYVSSNNKAPLKMQDLMQFLERNASIEKMLSDGSVVFIYGVRLQDMTQGTSNTLIAYEKDADTRGFRVVLFGDGSVDMLPDDEFQTKTKAQPRNK
jgi:hypothetical protein